MKNKGLVIFVSIIAVIILFNSNFDFFKIWKPATVKELDSYVNKYYFPVQTNPKAPAEQCKFTDVIWGANFNINTNSFPSSSSNCIFNKGQNYFFKKTYSVKTGSCSDLGQKLGQINGQYFLSSFYVVNKNNEVYVCKERYGGGYTYSLFSLSTKRCEVKSAIYDKTEPEGKYYCDKNNLYFIPCGKLVRNKLLVETCDLGCEVVNKKIDTSEIQIAKCKGDYKPLISICSQDLKYRYDTNEFGTLKIDRCSVCEEDILLIDNKGNTHHQCNPPLSNETIPDCKLILGSGRNQINIVIYNDLNREDYGQWVLDTYKKQSPFNEFTYNVYRAKTKNSCDSKVSYTSRDLKIGFEYLDGYYGWGQPSDSKTKPGNLIFSANLFNYKWPFLLLHESGHIYTHASHTCDGSIMQWDGGNGKFNIQQINLIRKNLNSTSPIFDSSYKIC